jgi:hypothetical protein
MELVVEAIRAVRALVDRRETERARPRLPMEAEATEE